jgi:hypothetical protein
MKLALASAALLGVSLAPAAHAQITCTHANRLVEAALDDFDDIAGKKLDGFVYETTYPLPRAASCRIDVDLFVVYRCDYPYASSAAASGARTADTAELAACLTGWSRSALTAADAADSNGFRSLGGAAWEGSGKYRDLEWSVSVEEHTDANGAHYHLWIELVHY